MRVVTQVAWSIFLSVAAVALSVCAFLSGAAAPAHIAERPDEARLRRPVALVAAGGKLYVANRRSGSVSVIDPVRGAVVAETEVGGQLADLAVAPDGRTLFAVDESVGELVRLVPDGDSVRVAERLAVGTSPVSVCVAPDGKSCAVALLWARQVVLLDLGDEPGGAASRAMMRRGATIDLPFTPRKQWIAPDGKQLVVADSFGGHLAVIDLPAATLRAVRTFHGHNIRGLEAAPGGRDLMIAHCTLDPHQPTERARVSWGNVIGNFVRTVPLDHLVAPGAGVGPDSVHAGGALPAERIAQGRLHPLGDIDHGAGDPGDMRVTTDGHTAVTLSGVNEVAIRPAGEVDFQRIAVGRRPTALAVSEDGRTLFAANTSDDSISVIDVQKRRVVRTISLGTQPSKLTLPEQGEVLFHDARLSLNGWYSCHTCHTDGHSNGLLNDNHSDGSFDTPKRVLSLGAADGTGPWAWDAGKESLEAQARQSILGTMQGRAQGASEENVNALAEYVRTITPPPSVAAARGTIDWAAVTRGRKVFNRYDCSRCHRPIEYTSGRTFDVGLRDEAGRREFNPPSLLGVSQRPAFFHDNRAATLRDVLTRFKHPDGEAIPAGELEDLMTFLESL